eukprot:g4606.t2
MLFRHSLDDMDVLIYSITRKLPFVQFLLNGVGSGRINVNTGVREDRFLNTGLHTVADIYCVSCNAVLGWKYELAFEASQKYKEGKFIIETARVMKEGNWW